MHPHYIYLPCLDHECMETTQMNILATSRTRWEDAWQIAIKWGRKNLKTLKQTTIEQASKAVIAFMNPEEQKTTTIDTPTQGTRRKLTDTQQLKPKKTILFLGASNLSRLPKVKNDWVQIVSYPGAKLQHAYRIIKNKTEMSPETQLVIMNLMIGNKEM